MVEKQNKEQNNNTQNEELPDIQDKNIKDLGKVISGSDGEVANQALQKEINELKDKLLRTVAELDNTRKRNTQQVSDLKKYAITDFAKQMITVVENFHLIIENAPKELIEKNEDLTKFYKGIEITHSDLEGLFEKNGITRIYPLGEKFDHNLHQVVSQVKSDKEAGTIIQVLQAGYTLNQRILKEAMVVISELK